MGMNKWYVWFFVMFLCFRAEAQDILLDKSSRISFFSEAPLENISAATAKAVAALNVKTNEIAFKVPVKSFEFNKRLMQQHFNENYMETDRFPYATFGGRVVEDVDWTADGRHQVTAEGNLDIHGVKKFYSTKATIVIKGGVIQTHAKFDVKLADHAIRIPRVVMKNIAEVVSVDVSATYRIP